MQSIQATTSNTSPLTAATSAPDVRASLDVRDFLTQYYAWRKAKDARFSYSIWADELQIKSRSYLRLLLVGKRTITERLIPVFIQGLKLNPASAKYFECLVRYHQSEQAAQKEKLFQELLKLSQKRATPSVVTNASAFLSSPLSPKIQVLLSDSSVDRSIPGLARILQAKTGEVRNSLELLERLKIAERVELPAGTEWRSKADIFDVPDSTPHDEALRAFHRRSLESALRAVELPRSERKFDSLFLVLSDAEYEEMLAEISSLTSSLLSRFQGESAGRTRLYQFNTNLIPISEPYLRPEPSRDAPESSSSIPSPQKEIQL